MTRIQFLILVAIAFVIVATSLPPWLGARKVSQAVSDVEAIADAVRKYYKHTGEYPKRLDDLVINPGINGWKGSYLEAIPQTPWDGNYQLLHESYKICIPANHPGAPEKYRLGGVAEISRVYLEGAEGEKYWWQR
jgi:type II secretory pathway pseudopilin PulG